MALNLLRVLERLDEALTERMARVAQLDELLRHLREEGEGEHILLAAGEALVLLAVLRQLRLNEVGGAAGDDVFGLDAGFGAHLLVDRAGQLAVLAAQHGTGFLREVLVALTEDNVHHGLRADDLARRCDQRGIAEVLTHAGDLGEHVVILILLACLLELGNEVGEHTAGHLIEQGVGVDVEHLGIERAACLEALGDLTEVDGGLAHLAEVQTRVAHGTLERGDEGFRRGLGGAVGERGERGIHDVHAGHRRHEIDHVARAAGVVGVQVDGNADGLLQALDEGVGVHRQQEVRHVLDAQGVRAHLLQLAAELDKIVLVVDGRNGIGKSRLDLSTVFLGGLDGLLQIAHVVERVENADDVDSVFNALGAELVHHVVGIVLVAENVLTAEEHLQLRVRQVRAQLAQALPWVLVQEAQAAVEGRAAPALEGIVADGVEHLTGGEHILQRHARGRLRLMRVTQDGIGDQKRLIR